MEAPLKASHGSSGAPANGFSYQVNNGSSNGKNSLFASTGEAGLPSTRNKLTLLQERISGFEAQMASEAAQRKTNEESRLQNVRESIAKLEKSLNAEIKRRVDGNKQLTQMFTQEVAAVQLKLEKLFVDKLDQLQAAVNSLNERTSLMETDFAQQKERYLKEVQEQNASVAKDVCSLQACFESEKLARTDRENQTYKKLGDLEMKTETQLEAERNAREQKYSCFHTALQEASTAREREEEKFQTFVLEEIATLKGALVTESQGRERADDDIVQAINHYTKALQDALRLVNTS